MPFINMKTSDDTKDKLEWLSEVLDDSQAGVIRTAIFKLYEEQKAVHKDNKDFLRWIRSNKQA
jgi:predicted transcriptional regulator